ncbi:hypothetical protein [Palleronia marisminoris]|uniref:hypothetical protein n=1 Tax=Palleronia marisminoris TaxID=315423 RepID=UPI00111BDB9E|nr:hypothetical protein [Palleronia marisminoris]
MRTAEHDGFTRIAIDFNAEATWRLEQDGTTVRILADEIATYDLADVYRRIGTERITSFRQAGPGELVVELACACAPETFRYGNSLVLDVSQDAAPLEPPRPAPRETAVVAEPLHRRMLLPGLLTNSLPVETEPDADPLPASIRAERAAALRAGLRADLGLPPDAEPAVPDDTPVEPEIEIEDEVPRPGQLQVESQITRDTRGYDEVIPRAACPAFAEETLDTWATLRWTLPPEAADAEWTVAEAKRLISLGFGIEAKGVLDVVSGDERDIRLLSQIAQLVDAPGPAPEIASVAECGDSLALFALISNPPAAPLRIGSVLDALAASPEAARTHLERRAIEGLIALGNDEGARLVAAASGRRETAGALPDLTSLTMAADDEPVPAADLEEIVARRTPEAAAALRMMVDNMVDDGASVPPDLLDQARAFLPEITGSDRHRLQRALIRAEITSGLYLRAAADIDTLAEDDAAMAKRLDEELFTTVSSIENDALFLTQIVSLDDRPVPNAELRIAIARRIAENHVPKLALRTLSRGPDMPTAAERLLSASLALDAGDANVAEAHLTGLVDPEAGILRERVALLRAEQAPAPTSDPVTVSPSGIRSRGSAIVEQSAALRAELEAFLNN